jgi:hypothetical protein
MTHANSRQLPHRALVALAVGSMIGVGILTRPAALRYWIAC